MSRTHMEVVRSLDLLYPPFAAKVKMGIAAANNAGYSVEVFETWRSPERQDHLYAQGRTRAGKIVTNARGWESSHQLGLAIDIALIVKGEWSWNFDPAKVSKYFIQQGLEWGGKSDGPHYQMTSGKSLHELLAMAKLSGVQRAWMEVSKQLAKV